MAADMEIKPGVVAEIWPFEMPAAALQPHAFNTWRSQVPPTTATILPLEKLEIPARETTSMVRVRGMLVPPQTGGYTIQVIGVDPAEFFLADGADGAPAEWRMVQRNGNPNSGAGRVKLEQGVAKRFEYWTMGRGKTSVQWELASRASEHASKTLLVAKQAIPASNLNAPAAKPGERHANGLLDNWKQQSGLDVNSGEGPNSHWGDPDGDGVPNWLEQICGGLPLKQDSEGRAGLIRWEVWRGIPGKYVFDLTRSANFPQRPDEVRYLRRLETPVGNGNDYGSRLRGLIEAKTSGDYTFLLAANDTAELWLGENESWQTKKLIARADQQGAQARWTRAVDQGGKPLFPEQTAKVALKKGQRYYIEILHKQQGREDFCAVAWIPPGAATPEVIGPDALVSWQRDKDDLLDTGLPDSFRQAWGLMADAVDPADRVANADPDHDGLTNYNEWRDGTDPLKPDAVATKNLLTCEVWTGLPGNRIRDLVLNNQYPANPTRRTLVDNLDFSAEGDSYGVRLRGYLTAPDDGPYIFYLSGNDACILYLAESEDKFTKHEIAKTISGTGWRAYGQNVAQQSAPLELKAGQRYYIELLFKRDARQDPAAKPNDHSSVAWKRPDRLQSVIHATYFSPYKRDPRDGDDDDLLDSFEIAKHLDPKDPAGAAGAWGDPDGDLLDNFTEMQSGLDPQVADFQGAPGFAMWERWENIVGNLDALNADLSFPLHPTQREAVTSFEGPAGLGNFYGSRLRAYLIPPVTGDYTFAISGDNQCELWLSPSELKYNKARIATVERWTAFREWDSEPGQVSKLIHLEAGKRYFIEALHKQDTKQDHVSVAFRVPGAKEFEIIRGNALAGFAGDPNDSDDDDILDSWQLANGIALGSRFAEKDLDGDSLTTRQEFLLGTRANLKDSDGDGVDDGDEINIYHSNPLVKDTPPPVKLADLPLGSFQAPPGTWLQTPEGGLLSNERRGAVSFSVCIETPGVYLVELRATARSSGSYVPAIPIIASVDGVEIGQAEVAAAGSRLRWLTAYLAAGIHTATIDNRNVRRSLLLEIQSLTFYQHEGADIDANGTPDWMDNLLRRDDHFAAESNESATSPVCVEGTDRFPGDATISRQYGPIETQQGLTGHWFANVPLDPSGDTKIVASFEGGTLHEERTIRWVATNIFGAPANLRVRVGDSLKLTAVPVGSDASATVAKFTLDGEALGEGSGLDPRIVVLDKPGTFTLAANSVTGQVSHTASVQIEVVAADFGPQLSLAAGTPRVWDLPNVPHSLVIEADPEFILEEFDRESTQSRRFTARYPNGQSGDLRVLARLWKDGPIAAVTNVSAFRFAPASVTGNSQVIEIMADGTRVVEVRYVIDGPVPSDLSIWLNFLVADAVFADGDTSHEITAADVDANGEVRILMYKAPGTGVAYICHSIRAYLMDQFGE